jgi:hypothetical protein
VVLNTRSTFFALQSFYTCPGTIADRPEASDRQLVLLWVVIWAPWDGEYVYLSTYIGQENNLPALIPPNTYRR